TFTRQGTLQRNVVRLPWRHQVNVSLARQIKLAERVNLRLGAEAFNIFNHPLFGSYDTDVQSPTFGVATDTLNRSLGSFSQLYQMGGPRSMQFFAKLIF